MKFDFRIQNHDEENEVLLVRYTPQDRSLGVINTRLSLAPDGEGNWPDREDILRTIRTNAPVHQWQRKLRVRVRSAEDLQPIMNLIGYEETGVEKPAASTVDDPRAFPNEATI